jgi:hypothetical protein
MGLSFNLGRLSPSLFTDSSLNVGIGAAPSGSYKLEVTGTAKVSSTLLVSGAATFSSTVTANLSGSLFNANNGALSADILTIKGGGGSGAFGFRIEANNGQAIFRTNNFTYNVLMCENGGNVGIGTSSPSYKFHVSNNTNGFISRFTGGTSSDVNVGIFGSTAGAFGSIGTESNHPFNIFTNGTDRMSITSGGVLCVRTTSAFTSGLVCIDAGTDYIAIATKVGTTGLASHLIFNNPNGSVGSINTSGSTTTYNTSSDYRLKQDLKNYNGLDLVSAIKTYDYEWKSDNTRMYGVMAHELAEVIPYAVQGEKDAVDEEGNIKAQGADYSKIVPILVKAIQEQQALITSLQSRLDNAGL